MGGIIEGSFSIGFKHPVYNISELDQTVVGFPLKFSARHEFDVLNGFEKTTTITASISNVELATHSVDWEQVSNWTDLFSIQGDKVLGLKYDKQAMCGYVPCVLGGSMNIAEGEFGGRIGVGVTNANGYLEGSIDIDYQALLENFLDSSHSVLTFKNVGPDGIILNQKMTPIRTEWVDGERMTVVHVTEWGTFGRHQYTYLVHSWAEERENLKTLSSYVDPNLASAAHASTNQEGFSNDNDWRRPDDGGSHGNSRGVTHGTGASPSVSTSTPTSDTGQKSGGFTVKTSVPSPSTGEAVYGRGVYAEEGAGVVLSPAKEDDDDNSYEAVHTSGTSGHGHAMPVILDLTGDDIRVTERSTSQHFFDANNDGLKNRIAWAAAGNAVLFYDPDNTGEITETRRALISGFEPTLRWPLEGAQGGA